MTSTTIVILFSILLFCIRLLICPHIYPDIFSYDFYGYIQLAKNIINRFDFSVHWFLDNAIKYPPLYPVLTYLLSFFTKNSLVSMQYINAFSSSFLIIPLFLLAKNILNEKAALLAVLFATYYYGLQRPCFDMHMDYFFSLLTITICWLSLRSALSPKPSNLFFLGIFISLTYLTKYSAILYLLIPCLSIFCNSMRQQYGLKNNFKLVSFLFLGFLPIFILYQAVFYLPSSGQDQHHVSDIGTYTFFQGNQDYGVKSLYKLNAQGTEFEYISNHEYNSILGFCIKHPKLLWVKYAGGFKKIIQIMNTKTFPFISKSLNSYSHFMIMGLLIVLIVVLRSNQWHDKFAHVSLFVLLTAGIPVYSVNERYLMPFIPLYFILWLIVLDTLWILLSNKLANKHKRLVRPLTYVIYMGAVLVYSMGCFNEEISFIKEEKYPYQEYFQAASWIKNDPKKTSGNLKIMSDRNTLAFLTDADPIFLPAPSEGWPRIVRFARSKKVDYIILDKPVIRQRLSTSLKEYLTIDPTIRMAYQNPTAKNPVIILKIVPLGKQEISGTDQKNGA